MKEIEKNTNENSIFWKHKIFKVYNDNSDLFKLEDDIFSEDINHIVVEDIQDEYEELTFDGWNYSLGFALDDDSFCLIYNKMAEKTYKKKQIQK
ncbi:MAG: hypothetical protein U9N76_02940 [Candidatus Marinimicrobia bacterium]|nr:hypothetical protein [Candidatus Neomarinimicrobiota bacterium]